MNYSKEEALITYTSVVSMEESKPHDTFKEAVFDFISSILGSFGHGISKQILETGCWIERAEGQSRSVLLFYDVIYLAGKVGLTESDGKTLVQEATDPEEALLREVYAFVAAGGSAPAFFEASMV